MRYFTPKPKIQKICWDGWHKAVDLGPVDTLRTAVEDARTLLRDEQDVTELGAERREVFAELQRRLLSAPFPELAGLPRLFVAPDGPLHRLPFEALIGTANLVLNLS